MKCAGCGVEIPKDVLKQIKPKGKKVYCCTQCAHGETEEHILLDGCY